MSDPLTPEEAVIREWVEAMTRASGSPLPPSQRRAEPLPRRRVLPVIVTLLDIIDGLRASRSPLVIGTDDAPEWIATLDAERAAPSPYADAAEHARQERAGTHLYDDNCAFCWFAEHGPDAERAAQGGLRERIEAVAKALAIGAVSYDGDSWFAADAGYGYDEAEAAMVAGREAMKELRALAAQPTPTLDGFKPDYDWTSTCPHEAEEVCPIECRCECHAVPES